MASRLHFNTNTAAVSHVLHRAREPDLASWSWTKRSHACSVRGKTAAEVSGQPTAPAHRLARERRFDLKAELSTGIRTPSPEAVGLDHRTTLDRSGYGGLASGVEPGAKPRMDINTAIALVS